ncbi:hypothetical protein [Paenibacillus cymbidii]|uniref:hypothetical protein n=1 Tax=Paenibacillus cymbidii TaxID=1639034 RepID=UPI001080C9B7|nr:hypothetical protein [Paenibacillus cymbidii]
MQTQTANTTTATTSNRNMLTAKELDYIKDYLSWELLAMKKCNDAANACTDMQIQSKLKQTGEKHKQHYETLLSHLH